MTLGCDGPPWAAPHETRAVAAAVPTRHPESRSIESFFMDVTCCVCVVGRYVLSFPFAAGRSTVTNIVKFRQILKLISGGSRHAAHSLYVEEGREFPSCGHRTLRNSHFSFRESGLFGGVFGRFTGAAYANEATKRSIVVLLRKVFPALPKAVGVCCRRSQRLSNRCKSCVYSVLRTTSAPDRNACRFRRTAGRDRKAAQNLKTIKLFCFLSFLVYICSRKQYTT